MNDSYVQVSPDSTGKQIDNSLVTTGIGTVYRQRTSLFDPVANQGANVDTFGRLNIASLNVTYAHTNPTITTSSSLLLSANSNAKYRFIQNTTATGAWLYVGGAAALNTGIYIGPNGSFEMSQAQGNFDNRVIYGISTSGSLLFSVTEGA